MINIEIIYLQYPQATLCNDAGSQQLNNNLFHVRLVV